MTHRDRHNLEYRIGADAVTWQLLHMDAGQLRAALLYLSARDEYKWARAIVTGRGLALSPVQNPIDYLRHESAAGETWEKEHPGETWQNPVTP